jgi:PKD repeat protein
LYNRLLILLFLFLGLSSALHAQLSADFTSNIREGCSPIVVNFQDRSSGGPVSWYWDFGNGGTSTLQNPSTTYINPGTYTVKLTIKKNSDADAQTVTKTAYITVLPDPVADFSSNTTSGCTPALIQFFDQSLAPGNGTVNSWLWDFGDNQTSTAQNPTHVYQTAGTYSITLTIGTSNGCRKLIYKPNYINIIPGVVPRFTYSLPSVCRAPIDAQFTNNSTGPGTLSYTWTFGDGGNSSQQSPAHTYTANNTYHVVLAVTSSIGCTDSTSANLVVGQVFSNFTFPAQKCAGTELTFTNTSTPQPIDSKWTFSTGYTTTTFNATTIFPGPGTYSVTLANRFANCSDTTTKQFVIPPPTKAQFTASDSGSCRPPLTVNFGNTPPALSYTWDFGEGDTVMRNNPSHTYYNYGSYNVKLIIIDTNGCKDSLIKPAYIRITRPQIKITGVPFNGCIPQNVTLGATINSNEQILSYQWNFGDGSASSTSPNPSHLYAVQGTYDVSVTITTSGGCTETLTVPGAVKVGEKPFANFKADTTFGCADPGIHFTNLSTSPTLNPPLQFIWDFGDGSGGSTDKDPFHVFTDTGWFNIQLTAINNGCKKDTMFNRYVYISPSVSKFTWRPDCTDPKLITFTDRSVSAATWEWDFGDGTTYIGQNPPPHRYASFGVFQVKLKTKYGSCQYTLTKAVAVFDPTPDFRPEVAEGCKTFNAHFLVSGYDVGIYRDFIWTYGDGSPADTTHSPETRHAYNVVGSYSVKLVVIDSFGCRNEKQRNNVVLVKGPTAAFGALNRLGCKGANVTFLDSSTTSGGSPLVKWTFDFGDSVRQSFQAPPFQHLYDTIGHFDVRLIVTDANGCMDSVKRFDFVHTSKVNAGFVVAPAYCPQKPLQFTDTTKSDIPWTSSWLFGDGGSSNVGSPTHSYTDTGYFNVTLTVQNLYGCRDTVRLDSAVHITRPKARFSANNLISYCTPFQASFRDSSYFASQWYWTLGPGMGYSQQQNPYAVYTQQGTYPIKLVITAPGGCKDSVQQVLVVKDPSNARFTYNPLSGCAPMTVNYEALDSLSARFIWDFGDGNVIDTTTNRISHRFTDFGDFTPKVIMTQSDASACKVALQGSDVIHLLGAKARFTLDTMLFCDRGTIIANSDSTTSNEPIVNYNWTFGDGASDNIQNPTHTYTRTGQYEVTLAVQTQSGCSDTLVRRYVKVVASPQVTILADSIVCSLDRVSYQGQLGFTDTSVIHWNWIFPKWPDITAAKPSGASIQYSRRLPGTCGSQKQQRLLRFSLAKPAGTWAPHGNYTRNDHQVRWCACLYHWPV